MSLLPASPLCVPDAYLTDERLRVLFNEFNTCLSHAVPPAAIFANLVNSVTSTSPPASILRKTDLLQDLVSASTTSKPISTQPTATQLTVQHEQNITLLTELQNEQLRVINHKHELDRARWGKLIPSEWVVGIDVVYGEQASQRPPNRIQELTGHGDCMNAHSGGKYVWLVPRYATDHASALTSIDIAIQGNRDDKKQSLAKGDSGKYRYLVPRSVKGTRKIYEVGLVRLDYAIEGPPVGYDGCTMDINFGRKGGYLYLIWKTWSA